MNRTERNLRSAIQTLAEAAADRDDVVTTHLLEEEEDALQAYFDDGDVHTEDLADDDDIPVDYVDRVRYDDGGLHGVIERRSFPTSPDTYAFVFDPDPCQGGRR